MLGQSNYTVTAVKHSSGIITAFLDELPGLIVQGKDHNDVVDKLYSVLQSYAKRLEAVDKNNFAIKMNNLLA